MEDNLSETVKETTIKGRLLERDTHTKETEQLVAAPVPAKKGPLLSISLLLAPHKGVRVEISHTSMLPP